MAGSCAYPRGRDAFGEPGPPVSRCAITCFRAAICPRLSPALRDVGLGVNSIKKALKLRESMVGSTLSAKGASGNYSIHHNYTNRTLAHRGQGTQIPS